MTLYSIYSLKSSAGGERFVVMLPPVCSAEFRQRQHDELDQWMDRSTLLPSEATRLRVHRELDRLMDQRNANV